MGQVLIRNVPDATIEAWKARAKLKGHSLEQELRDLLETGKPYTPEERVEASLRFLSRFPMAVQPLSPDDIRDGLE